MNGGRFESWLRCPCCVRRAEHVMKTVRRRVGLALATAGLAALAGLCLSAGPAQAAPTAGPGTSTAGQWWSGGGKIALIVIAVAVVGAFIALQVIARARDRRPPTFADWRTWPPGYDPETGTCRAPDRGREWS